MIYLASSTIGIPAVARPANEPPNSEEYADALAADRWMQEWIQEVRRNDPAAGKSVNDYYAVPI